MVCMPKQVAPTLNAGNDKSVAVCVAPSEASAGEAHVSCACAADERRQVAITARTK
jgi:5-deoxy-D-glucuronate isomerase